MAGSCSPRWPPRCSCSRSGCSRFGRIRCRGALVSCADGFAQAISLAKFCRRESTDTVFVCIPRRIDVLFPDGPDPDPTLHSYPGRRGVSSFHSHYVWTITLGRWSGCALWITNPTHVWASCCCLWDRALRTHAAGWELLGQLLPGSHRDGSGHDHQCCSLDYDSNERCT